MLSASIISSACTRTYVYAIYVCIIHTCMRANEIAYRVGQDLVISQNLVTKSRQVLCLFCCCESHQPLYCHFLPHSNSSVTSRRVQTNERRVHSRIKIGRNIYIRPGAWYKQGKTAPPPTPLFLIYRHSRNYTRTCDSNTPSVCRSALLLTEDIDDNKDSRCQSCRSALMTQ